MTDPTLPAQLARFLGTLGTVEIIVRVTPPADNWLLDVVTPGERDRIRLQFFEQELGKLQSRLVRAGNLRTRLYADRGEATVAGAPEIIHDLVRPGGLLAQHAQFAVLPRVRFVGQKSAPAAVSALDLPQRVELFPPKSSPRLPMSV